MQTDGVAPAALDFEQDLDTWFRFRNIPYFGAEKLKVLANALGRDVVHIFARDSAFLTHCGFSAGQIAAINQFEQAKLQQLRAWLAASEQHFVITYDSPLYPACLREIASAPLLLFGMGDGAALQADQLAIVGSRNPSQYGKYNATAFAKYLVESGFAITSGLAVGIDACAHQGALSAHNGRTGHTIAVLGSGVDVIYPKRHVRLVSDIIAHGGAVVSEFALGTPPTPPNFPRRNRIISGLAMGTLVIEASLNSGSLITANCALQQNREVFTIPGNINSPLSKGPHQLLKQGAKLVEEIQDIIDEYPTLRLRRDLPNSKNLKKSDGESLATARLLDSVDYDNTPVDLVAERSGLPVSVVRSELLEYELRGLVVSVPGGYIKLGG